MFQSYWDRDDVEERRCDLGRLGSGRPRRVSVASSLAGLRVLEVQTDADVTSAIDRAPPGLAPPSSSRLLDALCTELALAAALCAKVHADGERDDCAHAMAWSGATLAVSCM